jgi:hypothetical protein
MKKLILLFILTLLLIPQVNAEELQLGSWVDKLPGLKQGMMYDLNNHQVKYMSTMEIVKWKGLALEAGFSAENSAVVGVSYSLLKLKSLGVDVPILDLIEFSLGYSYGWSRIDITDGFGNGNNEEIHGPSVTLISLKF